MNDKGIYLTYLSQLIHWDGVGTLFRVSRTGCQGFAGPFPSAFLDKRYLKSFGKCKAGFLDYKILSEMAADHAEFLSAVA